MAPVKGRSRPLLLRTLFIRHALQQARAPSKTNLVLMAAALTWCENVFVGCTVTPTFSLNKKRKPSFRVGFPRGKP